MVYRSLIDKDEVLILVAAAHAVESRAVGYARDAVVGGENAHEVATKHKAGIFVEIGGIERAALIEQAFGGGLRLCICDGNSLHLLLGGFEFLVDGEIACEGGLHVFAAVSEVGEYERVFAFFESHCVISDAVGGCAKRPTLHTDGGTDEWFVGVLVADIAVDGYCAGVAVGALGVDGLLAWLEDDLLFGADVFEPDDVGDLVEGCLEGSLADFDVDDGLVVDEVGIIDKMDAALCRDAVEDVAESLAMAGYGNALAVAVCLPERRSRIQQLQ